MANDNIHPSTPRRNGRPRQHFTGLGIARRTGTRRAVIATIAAFIAIAIPAAPAHAGNAVTATINFGLRSVTVSPPTLVYGNCTDANGKATGNSLVAGGACSTGGTTLTITNGPLAGTIDVQGSDAIPADNGTHWTLCSPNGGAACTGTGQAPGVDQFRESMVLLPPLTLDLQASPQCDIAFAVIGVSGNCTAQPNQVSTTEQLGLRGPSSSTDSSTSFTTTITWTAAP
jgi:hypothetical protein